MRSIGFTLSHKILTEAGIDKQTKVKDLKDDEIAKIRDIISKNYKVEGELRSQQAIDIKRLMEIGSYRGLRHKKGLPVRGQRTTLMQEPWKVPLKTIGVKRGRKNNYIKNIYELLIKWKESQIGCTKAKQKGSQEKNKENILKGIVHIQSTFNNTVSISDMEGTISSSAGSIGNMKQKHIFRCTKDSRGSR